MQQIINYFLSVFLIINSAQIPVAKNTNIFLTGDIMLGRSVMEKSLGINDPNYPFEKVADKLKSADIVFSNLETPIISNCPLSNSGFKFCADPKMVGGLRFANVGIVNLANNHTLNYGQKGLDETEKILNDNGIKWVGYGNFEIIKKNGTKFGFLGFDYVDNKLSQSDLDLIKSSKAKVDVLIVATHWGIEYTTTPTETQLNYAKQIMDAGADVITGHHPHTVIPKEIVDGKPIFYSLGNFVFDQMWSEETRHGLVEELNFDGRNLATTEDFPIYLKDFAQPTWAGQ